MELKLNLEPALMPMAVNFAGTAAKLAGLGEQGETLLTLGVEELFMALCKTMEGSSVQLLCNDCRYAVDIVFRFTNTPPDLRVFNITSVPDHETEDGLDNIGLFLASRASDQFGIRSINGEGWEITLRKERVYPAADEDIFSPAPVAGLWRLSPPSPASTKALARLIAKSFSKSQFPELFTPPARLLDKVASGDYGVIQAEDSSGNIAGGLVWRGTEQRIVECFGPYIDSVCDRERLATELCEAAAALFGRSGRNGMVLYAPEPPPPDAGFEPCGSVETDNARIWAGYRMMKEEFGAVAYVSPELLPFYCNSVREMALARETREYRDDGETGDGFTLFSTRLDRSSGLAMIRPLLSGRDAGSLLLEHIRLFDSNGFSTTVCLIDTGRPFDSLIVPHLMKSGFLPRMIVPWGGVGDTLHLVRRRG